MWRTSRTVLLAALALTACAGGDGAPVADDDVTVEPGDTEVVPLAYPGETAEPQRGVLTFLGRARETTYQVLHGQTIVEGDVVVGGAPTAADDDADVDAADPPADLDEPPPAAGPSDTIEQEIASWAHANLWPNGVVVYRVARNLPNKDRVWNAMRHWKRHTKIRFKKRTNEAAYVAFVRGNGCSADIGRTGARQHVYLATNCNTASTIHEIGHTVGLMHEQTRQDRDDFITIHWGNIIPSMKDQFTKGDDRNLTAYDVHSIMQYSSLTFSRNGHATMTTKAGHSIPWNTHLSAADIRGVAKLYTAAPPPTSSVDGGTSN